MPANVEWTWMDRAMSWVNPTWGMERFRSRLALAWGQSYAATREGRGKRRRKDLGGSGDDHLDALTLWELREISQECDRNNGLSSHLFEMATVQTLGPEGFDLQAQTSDEELNEDLEMAWWDWLTKSADPSGEAHGWDLLHDVYRSACVDGDAAIQWDATGEGTWRQIEAARILTPDSVKGVNGLKMVHGISRGTGGRPEWYFVSHDVPQHDRVREDQGDYIHGSEIRSFRWRKRFSQSRGCPVLAPVIKRQDNIDDLIDLELMTAQLATALGVFIETDDPEGLAAEMRRQSEEDGEAGASEEKTERVEGGRINYLRPGQKASLVQGTRPTMEIQKFLRLMITFVALPLGLPYEYATLDFQNSTLGNQRVAMHLAQGFFKRNQARFCRFVSSLYQLWLEHQVRMKRFRSRPDLLRHDWGMPGWASPRPNEDATAAKTEIETGIGSRSDWCRKNGRTFDRVARDLQREETILRSIRGEPKSAMQQPQGATQR